MDATISHLAVAWNMPYIKTGIYGAERRVKLKELLNIEKKI
jgi:enolase